MGIDTLENKASGFLYKGDGTLSDSPRHEHTHNQAYLHIYTYTRKKACKHTRALVHAHTDDTHARMNARSHAKTNAYTQIGPFSGMS